MTFDEAVKAAKIEEVERRLKGESNIQGFCYHCDPWKSWKAFHLGFNTNTIQFGYHNISKDEVEKFKKDNNWYPTILSWSTT